MSKIRIEMDISEHVRLLGKIQITTFFQFDPLICHFLSRFLKVKGHA